MNVLPPRKGLLAGALATLALEAVRYPGFRPGFMPGNLPDLMGVLLLNRFALGPSAASTLAGFAYHFWNGAAFGAIFALLALGRSRWWAVPFGLALGAMKIEILFFEGCPNHFEAVQRAKEVVYEEGLATDRSQRTG